MKYDEEKKIQITFPKDYQSKDLAGKETIFKVKLNKIKQKEKGNTFYIIHPLLKNLTIKQYKNDKS